MRLPARLQHPPGRVPVVVGIAAVALAAALWFALAGPPTRAGAVAGVLTATASTAAALTAIQLSRASLARTDRQLAAGRRTTVLSRYPLLVPLHQSVSLPDAGTLAAHPPTEDRFCLAPGDAAVKVFLADTKSRYIVPVENVGEGPALGISGELWRSDGHTGKISGPSALAAGRTAVLTVQLTPAATPLPDEFTEAAAKHGNGTFWLDLNYLDIFALPRRASALFDPRGLGGWRQIDGLVPSPDE